MSVKQKYKDEEGYISLCKICDIQWQRKWRSRAQGIMVVRVPLKAEPLSS